MAELREIFEMVTKQIEPDKHSLKEQEQRQARSARNRKIRAMAVAAAITAAAALFAAGVLNRGKDGSAPATVTPSGSGLAFTVVGLDGSIRGLIPQLPVGAIQPDVSPDGSNVAFAILDGQNSQIATMRADGTGLQVVSNDHMLAVQPRWSPDGRQLLFYRLLYFRSQDTHNRGFLRLMVMNADGTNVRWLKGTQTPDEQPADWSPDGSLILYTSLAGTQQHLATVPATGGRSQWLTTARFDESGGTWSPDGQSIAFTHRDGLGSDQVIWVMDADGSGRHLLAELPGANAEAPEWSPDGTMIAFIGSENGIGGAENASDAVYIVDVATGDITEVLRGIGVGSAHETRATWLPDSGSLLVMTETP